MSDFPLQFEPPLRARFAHAFDREDKLPRALEELGPVHRRDIVVVDVDAGPIGELVDRRGASVSRVPLMAPLALAMPDASADIVISAWSAFRGVDPAEVAEVDRVLRDGGRQLAIHDYGRDDVGRLVAASPEARSWDRRGGPFAEAGFKIRVVHAWWTFESGDAAVDFVRAAFGDAAVEALGDLRRPRLSHNLAIYHRTRPDRPR